MTVHAARNIDEWGGYGSTGGQPGDILWWTVVYRLGALVGLVGLLDIVNDDMEGNARLKIITGSFGAVVLVMIMVVAPIIWLMMLREGLSVGRKVGVSFVSVAFVAGFAMTLLFAFYSDWDLGALAGDLDSRPSPDNAVFYWLYFVAKRLPMFSI